MTLLDTALLTSLLQNQVSNEAIEKIISSKKEKPDAAWYGMYFTDPELVKEFPNPGFMTLKDRTFKSKKFNNKLVYAFECYGEFAGESYINYNLYYEAEKPYNFLESDYVLKNKKKVTASTNIYYDNQELISNIFKDKNKTKINQENISYSLNNFLAPDIWSNCQDRKVGDQKEFIDLDYETGLYKKETYEIIDIKHTFINERKDRLTKTLVHSIDEDSGEPTSFESLSNSKCELLGFSLPQMACVAKLENKEKALSKKIN